MNRFQVLLSSNSTCAPTPWIGIQVGGVTSLLVLIGYANIIVKLCCKEDAGWLRVGSCRLTGSRVESVLRVCKIRGDPGDI